MANEVRDGRVPERTPMTEAVMLVTNGYAAEGWRTVSMSHMGHDVVFLLERKVLKNRG